MKVLLRMWYGKYYVWKKAVWNDYRYYTVDDDGELDEEILQTNIIAIENDTRIGHVVCLNCGKIIKNDPESIEAHYAEEEAKKDCLKCNYLQAYNKVVNDATCEKTVDGRHLVTQTFIAELKCKIHYWATPIDSEEVQKICIYTRCRRNGVAPINDMFVKYPGLFEKFVTVDTLINKKFEKEEYRRGFFVYDMKCRGNLKACVNEMGVIDHFKLHYRSSVYRLYYSEKYDLLFIDNGRDYVEEKPWGVPDKKMEQIKEKIAALYKEANK